MFQVFCSVQLQIYKMWVHAKRLKLPPDINPRRDVIKFNWFLSDEISPFQAEAAPIFQICRFEKLNFLFIYQPVILPQSLSQIWDWNFLEVIILWLRVKLEPEKKAMRWSWLYFIIKFVTFLSPLQLSWSKFIILRRNLLSLHYDSLVVKITRQILPRTSLIRHKNKPIRSEP